MSRIFLPLPLPLTPRQWFYIGGMQCLVAGIIDGGANFGIAYAMYHGQSDVRMWVFSKVSIANNCLRRNSDQLARRRIPLPVTSA